MNKLIVCPFSMQKHLLNLYRKNDVFSNVKAISKEELLNHKYGHYSSKTVAYVMIKENCTYENARTLLKYARYVLTDSDNEKIHHLYSLRNDLIKEGLLTLNPYFKNLFNNKEIHVYGYSQKDKELLNCLEEIPAEFHLNPLQSCGGTLEKHKTLDDEVLYMLNSIARLIDDGFDINDIYIYSQDPLVNYYIEKNHDSFGFKVNFMDGWDLFSMGIVSDFLNDYKLNKDIEMSINHLKEINSSYTDSLV